MLSFAGRTSHQSLTRRTDGRRGLHRWVSAVFRFDNRRHVSAMVHGNCTLSCISQYIQHNIQRSFQRSLQCRAALGTRLFPKRLYSSFGRRYQRCGHVRRQSCCSHQFGCFADTTIATKCFLCFLACIHQCKQFHAVGDWKIRWIGYDSGIYR